jgi:hypothetical protein
VSNVDPRLGIFCVFDVSCVILPKIIITPIFKKGDRMEPKNYRGIGTLNACYKIYSKILNMKLQEYSEAFMTETQNRFRKGWSWTDPTYCLKLLVEQKKGI